MNITNTLLHLSMISLALLGINGRGGGLSIAKIMAEIMAQI